MHLTNIILNEGNTKDDILNDSVNITLNMQNSPLVLETKRVALAGVAQWIEHKPVNQRAARSIPSQGTSLGCGPVPQ